MALAFGSHFFISTLPLQKVRLKTQMCREPGKQLREGKQKMGQALAGKLGTFLKWLCPPVT